MTPLTVHVDAVTFAAPVAEDWDSLRSVLHNGLGEYGTDWKACPACLSPRAAKRMSPQTLLALALAERIVPQLPHDAAWVFASSIGEGQTLQFILEALREPEMMIQPLRFQNSVHNAASGQWTIAAGLTGPATSIGAYRQTVGAGFLKAAMQVALEKRSVGLVLYDVPLPEPLHAVHPLGMSMGAGYALAPESSASTIATIELGTAQDDETLPATAAGRALADTLNPIAAVMPLMELLAGIRTGDLALGLHGGSALRMKVALA